MQPKRFATKSLVRLDRQPLEFVGIATADAPAVSNANEGRLYYDTTLDSFMVSAEGVAYASLNASSVQCAEVTFTETAGAGTYTGAVVVPAGATLLDIVVNGVALWNNAGTASMKVGDTDDDGYYTGIDLKATDLLAGESISFALAGGKAGAYIATAQVSPRYSATAHTINGIIVTSSTGGTTGRTRMTVYWSLPVATAATK